MGIVSGGHLLIRSLRNEGIGHIFALSGIHIQSIFNACIDEGVRIIDTRHEQAAVHMAEGEARVTGRAGVSVVTAGPGLTDAVTGVAAAFQSASPVIIISGRSTLAEFDKGSVQEMDQVTLMKSITKWARTVYETKRIPEYVSIAFRHAYAGRPGPVYLDIPNDILDNKVDEGTVSFPEGYRSEGRPQGEPVLIQRAVELLLAAKRPVVIAGSGVWWSQASEELQELVETMKLPLILTQKGRGSVPEDHPLCFGPTRVGTREADVVLVIGTRIDNMMSYGQPPLFNPSGRWIQVDIEASEIGHNRSVDIGIVGDAKAVLKQMIELGRDKSEVRKELPWVEECRAYVKSRAQRIEAELFSNQVPIHPLRLCQEIKDFLDRDATIVVDGGDISVWGQTVFRIYHPGHWLDLGPFSGLGPGIPFGIAAKLARPDKQVVILVGDGTFGLNGMEFDTAVRHNIPIVTVIGNDGAWGMIKHRQEITYGADRIIGSELGFTRYDKVVEALGGYGEHVRMPQDIRPALERAFASGLPACVNVETDPAITSPLTRRTSGSR